MTTFNNNNNNQSLSCYTMCSTTTAATTSSSSRTIHYNNKRSNSIVSFLALTLMMFVANTKIVAVCSHKTLSNGDDGSPSTEIIEISLEPVSVNLTDTGNENLSSNIDNIALPQEQERKFKLCNNSTIANDRSHLMFDSTKILNILKLSIPSTAIGGTDKDEIINMIFTMHMIPNAGIEGSPENRSDDIEFWTGTLTKLNSSVHTVPTETYLIQNNVDGTLVGTIDVNSIASDGCSYAGEVTTDFSTNEKYIKFIPTNKMLPDVGIEVSSGDDNGSRKLEESEKHDQRKLVDKPDRIDFLVAYTTNAKREVAKEANGNPNDSSHIEKKIKLAIKELNLAFAGSGIRTSARLMSTMEVYGVDDYSEDMVDLIYKLSDTNDGVLGHVHGARDNYGADIVALITGRMKKYCGVGYVNGAFSITAQSCISGKTFQHEIGHNFGCYHNRENSNKKHDYAHGYRSAEHGFRTLMSYGGQERINRFSTSDSTIKYNGLNFGTQKEDCARLINERLETVANFRRTAFPVGSVTERPTRQPTPRPTRRPTRRPTPRPTKQPTPRPTKKPTNPPTLPPTDFPSANPTASPSVSPTGLPTTSPSAFPTSSSRPSSLPSYSQSPSITPKPTNIASNFPSTIPTTSPTALPTSAPSKEPTKVPTPRPTRTPTRKPTPRPTPRPTTRPTRPPTPYPTPRPTRPPTRPPTPRPTPWPTRDPTPRPTSQPTPEPTPAPTSEPSPPPTPQPHDPPTTPAPTPRPSSAPSVSPTSLPTVKPTPGIVIETIISTIPELSNDECTPHSERGTCRAFNKDGCKWSDTQTRCYKTNKNISTKKRKKRSKKKKEKKATPPGQEDNSTNKETKTSSQGGNKKKNTGG